MSCLDFYAGGPILSAVAAPVGGAALPLEIVAMTYDRAFFTGIVKSGDSFVARWDGEFIGSFSTWAAANTALRAAMRR